MSLPTEAKVSDLKPFAHVLLKDERTLWNLPKDPNANYLFWSTLFLDADVASKILRELRKSASLSDQEYIEKAYPEVRHQMMRSHIFKNLNSTDIEVTKGQAGRTPLVHIEEVIHTQDTRSLPQRYKVIERLCDIYHDIGKSISAGIDKNSVMELMVQHGHMKHSHPNHDKISALALQMMGQHVWVQREASEIYQNFWSDLVYMVLHHHIYEDIKPEKIEGSAPQLKIPDETWELTNPLAAHLIFAFTHADINSNPKYQQYWPDKVDGYSQLVQKKWPHLKDVLKIDTWRNSTKS